MAGWVYVTVRVAPLRLNDYITGADAVVYKPHPETRHEATILLTLT